MNSGNVYSKITTNSRTIAGCVTDRALRITVYDKYIYLTSVGGFDGFEPGDTSQNDLEFVDNLRLRTDIRDDVKNSKQILDVVKLIQPYVDICVVAKNKDLFDELSDDSFIFKLASGRVGCVGVTLSLEKTDEAAETE